MRVELEDVAKTVGYYALFEGVCFGVVAVLLGISLGKLWFAYLLFLIQPSWGFR